MNDQRLQVPQKAWYGDSEIELSFPEDWQVKYQALPVEKRPRASHQSLIRAFQNPIGTKPLSELARGKKAPDGQVTHYLRCGFGKTIGGRMWSPSRNLPPPERD